MAFTTTQVLDGVLLRQLNFRTPANAPISSFYTLYASGTGQTYWSNAVTQQNISTLSTVLGNQTSSFTSSFMGLTSNVVFLNSSFTSQLLSTSARLQSNDQQLSNSVNSLNSQFNVMSNSLNVKVNTIYTSTLNLVNSSLTSTMYYVDGALASTSLFASNIYVSSVAYVTSTLLGISSISSFYTEISAVQSSVNAGLSSVSTVCGLQNTSTYLSLTSNYTALINQAAVSTITYVDQRVSSLSSVVALNSQVNTLSTVITQQLLSTSAGITTSYSTSLSVTNANLSSVFYSTIIPMQSTLGEHSQRIANLEAVSTSMSSLTNAWISSFVSTSQAAQDQSTLSTLNTFSSLLGYNIISTSAVVTALSSFSSINTNIVSSINSTNLYFYTSISSLQYEFSVLTTSSILAGVYDSFIQLENYTSSLIGSTIATTDTFKSTLYYSTTLQNASISRSYFNFYVSTLYASTLSTLIPSTIAFTSSMVSTLYSTSYTFLISSLASTTIAVTNSFTSTTSSLTQSIVSSSSGQLQSSILTYLSSPAGIQLSTFSSLSFISLSSFNGTGSNMLFTQSTVFSTNLSLFSTLFISSAALLASLSSASAASGAIALSSFSTTAGSQLSTQNGLFNSTISAYPTLLTNIVNSTNQVIVTSTLNTANTTLSNVQSSTITSYNNFIASLDPNTIGVSSLYTAQTVNLQGSNFTGTLDFSNARHFNVNVFNILNSQSNYRVTYNSNSLAFLDYRQGTINVNVSTVGCNYTNWNSQLRLDAYTWGLPTTLWGNILPYISNADYMVQYSYTIMNQTLYTTLMNVYPRIEVQAPRIRATVSNVFYSVTGTWQSNMFWRGTPLQVNWSNYCFFPFLQRGAPQFDPQVTLETYVGGVLQAEYGPYAMSLSTATITAPYLTGTSNIVNTTTIKAYIVGNPTRAATTTFSTIIPLFNDIYINNTGGQYIGGTELAAVTDAGRYPAFGKTAVMNYTTSTSQSYNADLRYVIGNINNGVVNRAGAAGAAPSNITYGNSNVLGGFVESSATSGFPDFTVNLASNYFLDVSTIARMLPSNNVSFTFSNAATSYTFPATGITPLANTIFRITNTGIVKTSNNFSAAVPSNFIRYGFTAPLYVSSLGLYSESTFIGPNVPGNVPDPNVQAQIQSLNTSNDAVSTLLYYNLLPSDPVSINSMQIQLRADTGAGYFQSTIITNAAIPLQTYRF